MPPKQFCGPEFCGPCEVPDVCDNPIALRTASAAIRSVLKDNMPASHLMLEPGFDNDQLVAIFKCLGRNRGSVCVSLLDEAEAFKRVGPPNLETC